MKKTLLAGRIMSGRLNIDNKTQFAEILSKMEGSDVIITITRKDKSRTLTQNAAIHLLFRLIANAMNEAGLDIQKVLAETADIPITADAIKEYMWKPIQKDLTRKSSTANLTTSEVNMIYEVLNRYTAENFGIHIPFPSYDFGDFI